MQRENYFILASFPGFIALGSLNPMDEELVLAEVDGITKEEAEAVAVATLAEIDASKHEAVCVWALSETESKKELSVHLSRSLKARKIKDKLYDFETDYSGDMYYQLAHSAIRYGEEILALRPKNLKKQVAQRFEVFDEDAAQWVGFDATDTQHWGEEYDDDWNGNFWKYHVEENLYRHKTGHWTLIIERRYYNAPDSWRKCAKRIDDRQAITWLIRYGYRMPEYLAKSAESLLFKPGEPGPIESVDIEKIIPCWSKEQGELSFRGKIVKKIRSTSRAKNIVKILDAFQEDKWVKRIDDPLNPSRNQQRLHEAIKSLNDHLEMIRFRADGTGEGIRWEMISPETELSTLESPQESDEIPF